MGYCTFEEVQEKVPHIQMDSTTKPTQIQVEKWIEQASDGWIDPSIRAVIDLPIEDYGGQLYLKNVCINWVVAEIYRVVETDPTLPDSFMNIAQTGLENVINDPSILINAASLPFDAFLI